jgi:hypothetical protein
VISQTRGNLADAESNYRIAISIDPDFVSALFSLAILRSEARAPDEAISLYETS